MSTLVFVVVIGAAMLHAAWNALVKSGSDKIMNIGAVILGQTPFALVILPFVPVPNVASMPYLVAGILLHAGYQLFLLKSYEVGDFTQVYPLARGSAPLLVTLFSVTLLGVQLDTVQLFAVIIIMAVYLALRSPNTLKNVATKGRPIFLFGGSASFVAYGIVIWAFTQAPIALVTALRETSIVFALLFGVLFLKERLDLVKVFSTFTTLVGAALLRFTK